jgi:hypothetical protein
MHMLKKEGGGVVQAVECLLCKHRALSSNFYLTGKKNQKHKNKPGGLEAWPKCTTPA